MPCDFGLPSDSSPNRIGPTWRPLLAPAGGRDIEQTQFSKLPEEERVCHYSRFAS